MSFDFWKICKDCGKCCSKDYCYPAGDKDIERIKNAGYKDFYKGNMLKAVDGNCIFFKEGKCSIYEIRPTVCQIYPITRFFSKDKPITPIFFLHLECPVARKLSIEEIDELIMKEKEFLKEMSEEEYLRFVKDYMREMKDAFNFE